MSQVSQVQSLSEVPPLKLYGLEPVTIGPDSLFGNLGERTNVTGSKAYPPMHPTGHLAAARAGPAVSGVALVPPSPPAPCSTAPNRQAPASSS